MQSSTAATPKTTKISCDTGPNAAPPILASPFQPSEMQLYSIMLSSAILENPNCVLAPSFFRYIDQRDCTREHLVSPPLLFSHMELPFLCLVQPPPTLTHLSGGPVSVENALCPAVTGPVNIKSRSLSKWQNQYCSCKCRDIETRGSMQILKQECHVHIGLTCG